MGSYAGLHEHDEYSLLDAISRYKDIVRKAKEYGYSAIAITNHGKMHSEVNFYKECLKQQIKPIIGIEAYECDDINIQDDTRYHLIMLAKNNEGLEALHILSSISHLKGFYYKPRIDLNTIKPYAKDLIIMSACMAGRVSRLISDDKYEEAKEWVLKYKSTFPNYYIEMQNHSTEESIKLNKALLKLSEETNTPFTLTDDAHFIDKEDIKIHSIFVQISSEREVGETYTDCHMKCENEIHEIMDSQIGCENVNLGIENTYKIGQECNIKINLKAQNQMPKIKIPDKYKDINEYYKHLINEGWFKRGINKLSKEQTKIRKDRILKEYDTLEYLGYIDYFIMLKILTDKARERGIPLGLSRGSGGNCYSLFLLGVTNIDSIRWNLDFSRFATKGRKSLADYDMDISKRRRKEMLDIAKEEFNDSDNILYTQVAPICTFNTLSTKVAIRDIGKVLQENGTYPDLVYSIRDNVSKLIPVIKKVNEEGEEIEEETLLKDTLDKIPKLQEYREKYPLWFSYVLKLEGLPKSLGQHPAGVVITPKPIIEYSPLCLNKNKEPMLQFEMHNVLDDLNLVKMDFLGLESLDIFDDALKTANHTWDDIDVTKLNLYDTKVYESTYKSGNLAGIFQMESKEAIKMNIEAKTDNIETVIAINACNRPATKELFPDYLKNKLNPKEMKLIHEDLRNITKESHGILLYQEQALAIFRLAGFPDDEVDLARRAIGELFAH